MPPLSPFLKTVLSTLKRYNMWEPGHQILVAVSGGADSMALLHALVDLQPWHGGILGIAHLNHGLREEADTEAAFVVKQASLLGLSCHVQKVSLAKDFPGYGMEEAGRMARYAFFNALRKAHGYTHITTAHHADDRIEQILMNLIRGCGPDGLKGIPALRADRVVRPLLDVHRREILTYLQEKNLPWKEDPSNRDTRFLRNRIRHTLLPLLEKNFNPGIRKALLRTGCIAEAENEWIDTLVQHHWKALLLEESPGLSLRLNAEGLATLSPGLQARILRHGVTQLKGDALALSWDQLRSLQGRLSQKESWEYHLSDRILVRSSSGIFEMRRMSRNLRQGTPPSPSFSQTLYLPQIFPARVLLPEGMGQLLMRITPPPPDAPGIHQAFPAEIFPLMLRSLHPGDRMHPQGRNGSRKVSRLLSEAKIPLHLRSARPLVLKDQHILWVPELPPANRLFQKIQEKTPIWFSWIHKNLPQEDQEPSPHSENMLCVKRFRKETSFPDS